MARNVVEGVTLIRILLSSGVKVHVLNVGLLDDTPMGNFFVITLLAVVELMQIGEAMLYRTRARQRAEAINNTLTN